MFKALLDIFFPPVCLLCRKRAVEKGFCAACRALIEARRITGPLCIVCGTPFQSPKALDHACGRCLEEKPAFHAARSAFIYDGPVLDTLHRFKYSGDVALAQPLARAVLGQIDLLTHDSGRLLVVPVPLYRGKLKERGFNQSLLLAREIARLKGYPLEVRGLKRARDTGQQVGLKAAERKRNVAGAFAVVDASLFKGRKALLVDDVATTGATLNECAKALRRAGAEVYALTVARAVRL